MRKFAATSAGGPSPEVTRELPVPGVVVYQPRRGFRYGAEAFWLAGLHRELGLSGATLDLGTGSGIVSFLLASQGVDVTGVDIRPEWQALWEASLADSKVQPELILGDVRELSHQVDWVVSNPPFFKVGAGPVAADPWKATARSEVAATVADFVACARKNARKGALFVVPLEREADVVAAIGACPLRIQVGRCRVLLGAGDLPRQSAALGERDPRVHHWYRRVGATLSAR